MKQHIINTICALVLLAGIAIAATDGIIAIFGCARYWQYVFNFAFVCVLMPVCVGALVELNHRHNLIS